MFSPRTRLGLLVGSGLARPPSKPIFHPSVVPPYAFPPQNPESLWNAVTCHRFGSGRHVAQFARAEGLGKPRQKWQRTGFYSGPLGDKVFIRLHQALRSATQPTWGRCPDCVASETSTPTLNGQRVTNLHDYSRMTSHYLPDIKHIFPTLPTEILRTSLLRKIILQFNKII
jgi:hypothetical protein